MLTDAHKRQLRRLAEQSIERGLCRQQPLQPVLAKLPSALQAPGACFVTLHCNGTLRGCIGGLTARRPLAIDVCEHAFNAAFRDHRFPALTRWEQAAIAISISVLGVPAALQFDGEAALLAQLQPGRDGLILRDGSHQSTFLPAVWEKLPEPDQFWRHLKRKAGLAEDYWSDTLEVQRYHTQSF